MEGDAGALQSLGEHVRLCLGAVEDGKVGERQRLAFVGLGQLTTAAGELVVVDANTVINNVGNQLHVLTVSGPGGPQLVGTFVDLYQVWGAAYQNGWLYLVGNRSAGHPVLAVYAAVIWMIFDSPSSAKYSH